MKNIAVLREQEYIGDSSTRKISAIIILAFVIALAASGLLFILTASVIVVRALLLFRLKTPNDIYDFIH